jgi:hypothetical protein
MLRVRVVLTSPVVAAAVRLYNCVRPRIPAVKSKGIVVGAAASVRVAPLLPDRSRREEHS